MGEGMTAQQIGLWRKQGVQQPQRRSPHQQIQTAAPLLLPSLWPQTGHQRLKLLDLEVLLHHQVQIELQRIQQVPHRAPLPHRLPPSPEQRSG